MASVKLTNVKKIYGKDTVAVQDFNLDIADKEFIVFVVLSLMGMLLNSLVLFICIDLIFMHNIIAKIIATAIVMVYNFVSRKIFLEKQ